MPLHDVGYRGWDGERSGLRWRWLIIAMTGIRLVWRGTWIRRTFLFTWLPVLVLALGFILYEQSIAYPELRDVFQGVLFASGMEDRFQSYLETPEQERATIWGVLLLTFFRYPQSFAIVLLIGVIAPRLISYDLRSRGYLLYFSRPITPLSYILGKSAIVWFYVGLITTIPALIMYLLGVLLSTEWVVVLDTWTLPFRILLASLVLIIPTSAVALAFSALTLESRYATIAWIAIWVLGAVAYGVLTAITVGTEVIPKTLENSQAYQSPAMQDQAFEQPVFQPPVFQEAEFQQANFQNRVQRSEPPQRPRGPRRPMRRMQQQGSPEVQAMFKRAMDKWLWVSPYHVLGRVQMWVFGFDKASTVSVTPYIILLTVVTLGSWGITYRRVRGRLRV